MTKVREEQARLPVGSQRKKTVRNIDNWNVQHVEISSPDRTQAAQCQIHFLGREFPVRPATHLAQARRKEAVLDVIALTFQLFHATAGHADVALFDEETAVLHLTG